VTLFEKANALGGQLRIATAAPHKAELERAVDFLVSQVEGLPIDVRLNTAVDVAGIEELAPDHVIVATGSRPARPPIEGVDNPRVVDAWDVLAGQEIADGGVVVVGGGAVGIETAEVLATAGKKVTVVEMLDKVGSDISPTILPGVLRVLGERGVDILTGHVVKEIRGGEVVLQARDGSGKVVAAETVVLAVGTVPEDSIVGRLQEAGIPISVVGDCCGEPPCSIEKATRGGFFAALTLGDAETQASV
jgi:pyruvate/2-oxoglutarate dehydrogenase complex dihydrolipoamide dehydrogenase (E3) component